MTNNYNSRLSLLSCDVAIASLVNFDTDKYELATVCHRNHHYRGQPYSLKRKQFDKCKHRPDVGTCVRCKHEQWLEKNPQHYESISLEYKSFIDFDTSKYELDRLCANKHEYKGSGLSLRRKQQAKGMPRRGKCPECKKEENKRNTNEKTKYQRWLANPRISESVAQVVIEQIKLHESEIDQSKFYLGSLCPNSHEWRGTNKSLRSCGRGHCVVCKKEYSNKHSDEYKEKERYKRWLNNPKTSPSVHELVERERRRYQKKREYYENNIEKYRESSRKRYKERYWSDPEKERLRQRVYKHSNPEKLSVRHKRRRDRVIRQNNKTVTTGWLNQEMSKVNKCLYCGKSLTDNNKSVDHLIPIAKEGLHATHNIVICCRECNYAKGDKQFVDWLEELEDKYKKKSVQEYKRKHGVDPTQLHLPLTFN